MSVLVPLLSFAACRSSGSSARQRPPLCRALGLFLVREIFPNQTVYCLALLPVSPLPPAARAVRVPDNGCDFVERFPRTLWKISTGFPC